MRVEYTSTEERMLRITEIEAILENDLYVDKKEEKELITEKKELEFLVENIKYYEVELGKSVELNDDSFCNTPDRYSMCILGNRMPTLKEAEVFLKKDMELMGYDAVTMVIEIDFDEAHNFFDMEKENQFPIFN